MSDVWVSSASDAAPLEGNRVSMNQAFSVEVVFRLGWASVQRWPAVALTGGFALVVLQYGPSILNQLASLVPASEPAVVAVIGLAGMVLGFGATVFAQFVTAGLYVAFSHLFYGREASVATVFTSGRQGLRVLIAVLVAGMALGAAMLVLFVPALAALGAGIYLLEADSGGGLATPLLVVAVLWLLVAIPVSVYVGVFAQLVPVVAALEEVSPIEAIARAWDRTNGARLTLFVTSLAFALAQFLACCLGIVGLIPVLALYHAGLAAAWLLANRPAAELAGLEFFQENASDLLG